MSILSAHGKLPPMPILDAHTHAFPDHVAPGAMKQLVATAKWCEVQAHHDGTLTGLLAGMDRAGIRRTIVCSIATRPTQVKKITDWSASNASDRIIPFASIHPDYDAPEAEVRRIAAMGIRGLKFHPQYMKCPADDPRILRIVRAAAQANLAIVFHAGQDLAFDRDDIAAPHRIAAVYDAVPGMRLMACHMGGWQDWEETLRCIAGRPIYLETSFSLGQCPDALFSRILSSHNPDYLLFGSDAPWADPASELALFRKLPLPAPVIQNAIWANAHRFLDMVPE